MLIVFAGLPGTGKTTLARALAARLGLVYLRIDSIEQALRVDCPGAADSPAGYGVARALAADNLRSGLTVVVDGVNAAPEARAAWVALAAQAKASLRWVEVCCTDAAEHRRRVQARTPDIAGHQLPDWATIQAMRLPPLAGEVLRLDTADTPAEAAMQAMAGFLAP